MQKAKNGFTIIEILVVIALIGILTSISVMSYSKIQVEARDSARESKASIITEALEKYFLKNGEYPSCANLAAPASVDAVASSVLGGIDVNALATPTASKNTNSIVCNGSIPTKSNDVFLYNGDTSDACSTGSACTKWTLQYIDESSGDIVSINSRHGSTVNTPVITATVNSTSQITISWPAATNALSYTIQCSTDGGATWATDCVYTTTGLTYIHTGLITGKKYYYRVKGVADTFSSSWSNIATATTTVTAPPAPSVSAAMSGSTAVGTVSAVACAANTSVRYQTQYNINDGSWTAWSESATIPTVNVTNTNQGYKYQFNARAYCQGPDSSSAYSSVSTASVVRSIDQPATPVWINGGYYASNEQFYVNYASYCPSGSWVVNAGFRSLPWPGSATYWYFYNPWGFLDSWVGREGSAQNVEYWGYYQCATNYTTSVQSPWSYTVITIGGN